MERLSRLAGLVGFGSRQPLLIALLAGISAAPPLAAQAPGGTPDTALSQEAVVYERSRVTVTAEADGTSVHEVVAEMKINAEAGVKALAVLNFTYASANQEVDVNYVRVRKPDGSVIETPAGNIQDMPADITRNAPIYSDIHEKHVAVKGLGVGDVLMYDIRYRTITPQVPNQFWFEYAFTRSAITKEEILEISVPAGMRLKVSSPTVKPTVRDERGRRLYRWVASNPAIAKPPPISDPGALIPPPSVQVTTFDSWTEVGDWLGGLQKEAIVVTPDIRAKAEELTRGLATDEEKIRAIYNFVSLRFHYVGLDFGIGRYQPHPATEVLGNRYGDCKDKHALLAALLKAAGYDAWPAFVHGLRHLDPAVPSPAQFNHVLTVVSYQGKLVWLDTTPEIAPYGLLVNILRNKQALVVPTDGPPRLMRTPAEAPFPQEVRFAVDGRLSVDGVFTGRMDWEYRGDVELLIRSAFRGTPASQWQDIAQRLTYAGGFGGAVSNLRVSDPDDIDRPFQMSYDYERKDYGRWAERKITPPMPQLGILSSTASDATKGPVYLGAPTRYVTRSRLELPPPYTLMPPAKLEVSEAFADYRADYAFEEGALVTSRVLTTKSAQVTEPQWEAFVRMRNRVNDDQTQVIDVTDPTAAVAEEQAAPAPSPVDALFAESRAAFDRRDYQRAQELLERVMAAEPDYPGAHMALALVLASQRQFEEALGELRKEQRARPQDVAGHRVAAGLLLYLERKEEAIEEWRKVLAIDPRNLDAALALSDLLVDTGKPREATTVLEEAVRLSPESPMLQLSLGKAYVGTNDVGRGLQHLRRAAEGAGSGPQAAYVLNEVAYCLADVNQELGIARQYAERAISEVESESASLAAPDSGVLRRMSRFWDTLGWIGFRTGDLALAESYVYAAWLLDPTAVIGLHLGQVYERQGRPGEAAQVYVLALTLRTTNESRAELQDRAAKLGRGKGAQPAGQRQEIAPAEELRRQRHRQLENPAGLSGSADFYLFFSPARVESVRYVRGDERLKGLGEQLAAAGHSVAFPSGSKARIPRQVTVSCEPAGGCDAALEPL